MNKSVFLHLLDDSILIRKVYKALKLGKSQFEHYPTLKNTEVSIYHLIGILGLYSNILISFKYALEHSGIIVTIFS
jgi:hypothetical protein